VTVAGGRTIGHSRGLADPRGRNVLTVYSDSHHAHRIELEHSGNAFVPCYEQPVRADDVLAHVRSAGLGPVIAPADYGRRPLTAIHAPDYVDFLERAWSDWIAAGHTGDAFGGCTPMADMNARVPSSIQGRLGYYSFDTSAPITAGTWRAAYDAAQCALTGADLLAGGERAAFALCRPPGHHASTSYFGGYCYLNNVSIAAQALLERGRSRIAILDVDFHHGNGTQSIFYARSDVLFASIHGDPSEEYPYFSGYAEETGAGEGEGCNCNFPLPPGSGPDRWFAALADACARIRAYRPQALVVSLGVDTFERDPISSFKLRSSDYVELGRTIRALDVPTLFALEGGYALDAIGVNVTNTLEGFQSEALR
jgi:acetoin utilization deacetylase AcuC-like enzyme